MLVKTYCAAVNGLDATIITVEVNKSRGVMFHLTGLPDNAVRESRDRIAAALENNGYRFPVAEITINMAPADIRKEGSGYDLPIAIAILACEQKVDSERLGDYIIIGELGLDGRLQPIKGALPIAIKARAEKYKGLIVPKANIREAAVVNNINVYGMENISEVIRFLNGDHAEPEIIDTRKLFFEQQSDYEFDFADVKGQQNVKRAMEVAAAGGHNMIMIGPPGSGKSMLAKRLPSILPPLSLSESLETTQIHSVAGKLNLETSLISQRPFRSPHHTISQVALVGGGSNPQPGEISLAHNGVLFCDELPEFNRSVLEVMRQPLEDRKITISRAKYTIEYPCSFMFVASMNPCPCGYYGEGDRCTCSPAQRMGYLSKLSGPILDRMDIQLWLHPVDPKTMMERKKGESSAAVQERVLKARIAQKHRFAGDSIFTNAEMDNKQIEKYCPLSAECRNALNKIMERLHLSMRAFHRIIKVARTIADLEGAEEITSAHIVEAASYRFLDKQNLY